MLTHSLLDLIPLFHTATASTLVILALPSYPPTILELVRRIMEEKAEKKGE